MRQPGERSTEPSKSDSWALYLPAEELYARPCFHEEGVLDFLSMKIKMRKSELVHQIKRHPKLDTLCVKNVLNQENHKLLEVVADQRSLRKLVIKLENQDYYKKHYVAVKQLYIICDDYTDKTDNIFDLIYSSPLASIIRLEKTTLTPFSLLALNLRHIQVLTLDNIHISEYWLEDLKRVLNQSTLKSIKLADCGQNKGSFYIRQTYTEFIYEIPIKPFNNIKEISLNLPTARLSKNLSNWVRNQNLPNVFMYDQKVITTQFLNNIPALRKRLKEMHNLSNI